MGGSKFWEHSSSKPREDTISGCLGEKVPGWQNGQLGIRLQVLVSEQSPNYQWHRSDSTCIILCISRFCTKSLKVCELVFILLNIQYSVCTPLGVHTSRLWVRFAQSLYIAGCQFVSLHSVKECQVFNSVLMQSTKYTELMQSTRLFVCTKYTALMQST